MQVIPFGVSSHHRQFWGTIYMSPSIFKTYVKEVCLALNYYGAREVVIVNGLGGNLPALIELAKEHARACVSIGRYIHFGIYQKTK
jgi:creatinine amidohydrolase